MSSTCVGCADVMTRLSRHGCSSIHAMSSSFSCRASVRQVVRCDNRGHRQRENTHTVRGTHSVLDEHCLMHVYVATWRPTLDILTDNKPLGSHCWCCGLLSVQSNIRSGGVIEAVPTQHVVTSSAFSFSDNMRPPYLSFFQPAQSNTRPQHATQREPLTSVVNAWPFAAGPCPLLILLLLLAAATLHLRV